MEVIEGRGPAPTLVWALIKRLPDTSLTVALASGGRDHFGWGTDRHIAADLFDAIQANTRATGNFKKGQTPKLVLWPRPKLKKKPDGARSVKDLFKKMSGR